MCFTHEVDVELAREQSAVGRVTHPPPEKSPPPRAWNPSACYLPQQRGTAAERVKLAHQLDLRGETGLSVLTGLLQTEEGEPGRRSVKKGWPVLLAPGMQGPPEADRGDVPGGSVVKNRLSLRVVQSLVSPLRCRMMAPTGLD